MTSSLSAPRLAAIAILLAAAATIGGAYLFEYGYGYIPCELCLLQRKPYYVAMPVALATALMPARGSWLRGGLAVLSLIFLISAGLGIYHAGVEWHFWAGPAGCSGGGGAATGDVNDFMKSLNNIQVVSCTDAAWRLAGISLAGWNALISLALAALGFWGFRRA